MFVDQFWKILFIIILGAGCWFWWTSASKKRVYNVEVASLAEFLDTRPEGAPKTEKEAEERTFKAVALMQAIVMSKGKKFEIREALNAATKLNEASHRLADIIADVAETNYKNAKGFGILDDDDAMWRLEQGSAPTIVSGPWAGDTAEVGYHIPPDINAPAATHMANRIIVPQSVKAAMPTGDLTKNVDDWAERLKNAQVLNLGDREDIKREYKMLQKEAKGK